MLFRTSKNRVAYIVCLSLGLLMFLQQGAAAKSAEKIETLLVTGTGKIRHNNAPAAREAAIEESLAAAAGLVMAELLPREIVVQNFQTLNEVMYSQSGKFVRGYRVLAETKYKDRYRVMVEVNISTGTVKAQLTNLGFVVDRAVLPKVLILMAQQNIGDSSMAYWWGAAGMGTQDLAVENAITDTLSKKGFSIAGRGELPPALAEKVANMPQPDTETAITIARHFNAEFVIVGSAYAQPASNTMGSDVRSFKATVSARAVNVKTGEEVAATYQTEVGVSTDERLGGIDAISRAGALAGDDIAKQIIMAQRKQAAESATVTLIVKGTQFLSHFVKFRKALSDIPAVGEIQTREMKIDEAVLSVDYPGKTQQLANALMLKSFNDFGINISELTGDTIHVELIPTPKFQPAEKTGEEPLLQ